MKIDFKKLKWVRLAWISIMMALSVSQTVMAASYTSSATLPTVHSKGYLYRVDIPVKGKPAAGAMISNVSWNWNVVGWPQYLQVSLCAHAGHCLDISRQRSGSTHYFSNLSASQPFYFTIRMAPIGRVPVGGQQALLTVNW